MFRNACSEKLWACSSCNFTTNLYTIPFPSIWKGFSFITNILKTKTWPKITTINSNQIDPTLWPPYISTILTVTLPRISKRLVVLGKLDGSPKKFFQKQHNTSFRDISFAGCHKTNKNVVIKKIRSHTFRKSDTYK